tara:strand:- start:106 stop:972 length:867 start_codon:yes stop_codon:yes gene_type:complete
MTYNRSAILEGTIKKILSQSLSPEKVLIIDNSDNDETEKMVTAIDDSRLEYLRLGYNAGPAGSARIGLEMLASQGYDWIYWGDDDDPPKEIYVFENLINKASTLDNVGCIGSVGNFFNSQLGALRSVSNLELKNSITLDVDVIPGGHNLIVNGGMVRNSYVLPNEKYFFSFEDLYFCFQVKKNGYRVVVDSESWYKSRLRDGLIEDRYYYKAANKKKPNLNRAYYSHRNLLHFLFKNGLYQAFLLNVVKGIVKPVYFLKFGVRFSVSSTFVFYKALFDFLRGKYSKRL